MGSLVDGKWQKGDVAKTSSSGHFVRADAVFRNWITPDGSAGPTGRAGFAAESGRYHLYVSLACPWASRTLIMRAWKKLEPHITLSVTHWLMGDDGWTFQLAPGVIPDALHAATYLHQLYTRADPHHTGKVTVPVLWDKQADTIVSNESADIIRMFNSAFQRIGASDTDYLLHEPSAHQSIADRADRPADRLDRARAALTIGQSFAATPSVASSNNMRSPIADNTPRKRAGLRTDALFNSTTAM